MISTNLPWAYSHLKSIVGYRKWEAIKHLKDQNKRQQLLDAFESGKKILFIHIPKTAGVSLIKTYEDYFADARHSPALLYKLMLGTKFENFSSFSVVRNPWARLYSAYNFLMEGGLISTDREMGCVLAEQCPSFDKFIKKWLPKNEVYSYMHFVPQYEFLCGWGGKIIVKNIVKLEQLNNYWPVLADKLSIPLRQIKSANVGKKGDFRVHYDNESIDIVRSLYKKDIELLNYSYE